MADFYWVASAAGNWSNPANWSATIGGTGGAGVPGSEDNALFMSGNADCLIDTPATVAQIWMAAQRNLTALAPLTCEQLNWAGKRLLFAESQIGTLNLQPNNPNDTSVVFDPFCGASYAPQNLTWTQRAGNAMTFQWDAVPQAISYEVQYSTNNGTSWNGASGGSAVAITSYTGNFSSTTNYLLRVRAAIPGGSTEWCNSIPFNRTDPDFSIPFVPSVPVPLTIETLNVVSGSTSITIENQTEVHLSGDVIVPNGVIISHGPNAKWTLLGTQDQDVNLSVPAWEFSLDKPAGKLTLFGAISLRSDLLRDPAEIDPRTATLMDIETESSSTVHLSGDVACRSFKTGHFTDLSIAAHATLDTFQTTLGLDTAVSGTGAIRVHQNQLLSDGFAFSNPVIFWTVPIPPPPPNAIFVHSQRVTEIDLWWSTVNSAISYTLERATNYAGAWTPIYSGPALLFTDSDLTPETLYYYRLKATNADGDSQWSPIIAVETTTYLAPVNLVVSSVTAGSMALQWTSEYNPIDHLVAWSPNGIDSWTEIQTLSQSSLVIMDLTPETTYYLRVRARYAGSNSPWSEIVNATTLPVQQPINTSETWSVIKRLSQKFEVKTALKG